MVGVVYPVHFRETDETGQFWKKMPMHTFIFESEKICLKVPEDCVTLFIFRNAWGWNLSNKYQHKNFFIFISHIIFCVCLCPQTVTSQKFLYITVLQFVGFFRSISLANGVTVLYVQHQLKSSFKILQFLKYVLGCII